MSVGKNIKRLRILHDLTQKQLGEKIGVTDKAISSWEIDRTEPDIGMIEKLCDVFECKKTDIIGEDLHQQYYLNDETVKIAQEIFDNKDLRTELRPQLASNKKGTAEGRQCVVHTNKPFGAYFFENFLKILLKSVDIGQTLRYNIDRRTENGGIGNENRVSA